MNIPDKLLHYLTNFLERSHPSFGNLPPCPFAKKERLEGRILCLEYHFMDTIPTDEFLETIREFDANSQYSTFIAYDRTSQLSLDDAYALAQQVIDSIQEIDILAIPLHPEDPYSPSGVRTRATPYLMFAIQRRSLLSQGQQQLLRTKYYHHFEDQEQRNLQAIEQQCAKREIFFPLLWWKENVLKKVREGEGFPEPCPENTLRMQNSNEIHMWFHQYGKLHQWFPFGAFSKVDEAQELVRNGKTIIATAHGGDIDGYVELLDGKEVVDDFFKEHYIARFLWVYEESVPNVKNKK